MALNYVSLPLFQEADYEYTVSLERVSYKLRFYYNTKFKQWAFDLRYANGDPIVLGEALVSDFPMFMDYQLELTGFFWLESIGPNKNQTLINPFEIDQYYRLYYYYEEE